jgi:hypothetical protein
MNFEDQVELVSKYFKYFKNKELTKAEKTSLFLYKAIQSYRMYNSLVQLLEINPEFVGTGIENLWEEFDSLTPAKLADISLDILQDINKI